MGISDLPRVAIASLACISVVACGGAQPAHSAPQVSTRTIPDPAVASTARRLMDWPEFGLDPQRSDVSEASTGITSANVAHLRHVTVSLQGTVDSSPIYLHGALVDGASHDLVVVTTTYGRTLAIDAEAGTSCGPSRRRAMENGPAAPRITTASPLFDPDRQFVYAASPNGLVHKLSLANGQEDRAGGWPVRITTRTQATRSSRPH